MPADNLLSHALHTASMKVPVAARNYDLRSLLTVLGHLLVADHAVIVRRGGGKQLWLLTDPMLPTEHVHASQELERGPRLQPTREVKPLATPSFLTLGHGSGFVAVETHHSCFEV